MRYKTFVTSTLSLFHKIGLLWCRLLIKNEFQKQLFSSLLLSRLEPNYMSSSSSTFLFEIDEKEFQKLLFLFPAKCVFFGSKLSWNFVADSLDAGVAVGDAEGRWKLLRVRLRRFERRERALAPVSKLSIMFRMTSRSTLKRCYWATFDVRRC